MNYVALKNEILSDPRGMGYAGKDVYAVAGLLNAPSNNAADVKALDSLAVRDVLKYLAATPVLGKLADHAANSQSPIRSVAMAALKLLDGSISNTLELDAPVRSMLAACVSAGVATQAEADGLLALAQVRASRAEVVAGAGTFVSANDVAKAMGA